jgi:REP-associated tyrosine transposase
MSRLRRIEEQDRFFFVTTNLRKGVADFSPHERTLVLEILARCRDRMGFKVFAYVVMPDHTHLMLEPADHTLTAVMREFKSKTALLLNRRRRANGPLWQTRFFDFICRRVRDFSAKVEYIHQNPVSAGLVKRPEEWPWSSAGFFRKVNNPVFVPDLVDLPANANTLLWPAPWR